MQHGVDYQKQTIFVFKTVVLLTEVLLVLFDGQFGYGNIVINFRQGRVKFFTNVVIAGHQVVRHIENVRGVMENLRRIGEPGRYRYRICNVAQMNDKRRVHGIHLGNQSIIGGGKLAAVSITAIEGQLFFVGKV
jgi:hypothetical protein